MLLLELIIASGEREVPVRRLADAIWPDDDGDAALSACTVALHRLRKLITHADTIETGEGVVSLNLRVCWIDAWALFRRPEQDTPSASLVSTCNHGVLAFLASSQVATAQVLPAPGGPDTSTTDRRFL